MFLKERERGLMFDTHAGMFTDEATTGICFRGILWVAGRAGDAGKPRCRAGGGLVTRASLLLRVWKSPRYSVSKYINKKTPFPQRGEAAKGSLSNLVPEPTGRGCPEEVGVRAEEEGPTGGPQSARGAPGVEGPLLPHHGFTSERAQLDQLIQS